MDQRIILKTNERFDGLLQEIKENNEPARLLYDDNGIQRANGMIVGLELKDGDRLVTLDNGQKIFIDNIIGANGVFKDDYTEC